MQNTVIKDLILSAKKTGLTTYARPQDRIVLQYVEQKLNKIFFDEINSKTSIFKKVSNNAVFKMALFISGHLKRSCSIGIAGETASGKSTIAYDIINTIIFKI